jgi:hypothetical protein
MLSRTSSAVLGGRQSKSEWFEPTLGERFSIRTSASEAEGNFTILEVVADPRNGVPMHIPKNEEETSSSSRSSSIPIAWRRGEIE